MAFHQDSSFTFFWLDSTFDNGSSRAVNSYSGRSPIAATKLNWYWALTIVLLVAITVIGGIVTWSRYSPSQPIEISIPSGQEWQGRIYIDGAVANPRLAVISAGEDNPFDHPSDEVVGRLEQRLGQENIYRTDEHGKIKLIGDGKRTGR